MASAHGAGLMIIPVLLGAKASFCSPSASGETCPATFAPDLAGPVITVHTLSHLAVAGLLA